MFGTRCKTGMMRLLMISPGFSMSEQAAEDLVPSSIKGIHHVGMAVSDVKAAVAFYESATSLGSVSVESIGGGPLQAVEETAVLKAPNGYIELMQFADRLKAGVMPVQGPGVTHICFQSPASVGLFNKFEQLHATAVSCGEPPIDLNGQGVRYAYSRDADDIMFEVEQLDKPNFEGPIWLAHIALVTHDIDALVSFYRNLLGIEPYSRVNKVTGPRFDEVTGLENVRIRAAWFNTGNMVIELWQFVNPVTPPPGGALPFNHLGYNKFALEVGDLQAECRRLTDTGLELIGDPLERNGVTEVYARDPDGNLFSLLQTEPAAVARVDDLEKIDWLPSPSSITRP